MSFFGFDTTLPRDKPEATSSRGIFEQHDPFAGLSGADDDDGAAINFDDTYDGLGQALEESGDTFNDDTFGGDGPVTRDSVGKDFDFAGRTAQMRGYLQDDIKTPFRQPPVQQNIQAVKPAKSGYERYKDPGYMPKLEADASIWGKTMGKKPIEQPLSDTSRKMMSLEEVEASMRALAKPTPPPMSSTQSFDQQSQGLKNMLGVGLSEPIVHQQQQQQARPVQILQRPQQQSPFPVQQHRSSLDQNPPALQMSQHQPSPMYQGPLSQEQSGPPMPQLQFGLPPNMYSTAQPVMLPNARVPMHPHARRPSYVGPPITQAQQLMSLPPEEREAYLAEEARRAKRNHKIFLLSKNNGLMTPQDKNFITRIQLSQLLTATGGVDNEPGSDAQLAEDFYCHVYGQIRGHVRSAPGQPTNQFAQTYLFQTSSRYGYGRGRHHPRGGDNHIQRMEQQVARAVEAAKARPKNKSLVVEGSLGKIAFSNSKTPRPLLNFKPPDADSRLRNTTSRHEAVSSRKSALRDIEHLYTSLMKLEDHERKLPPPPNEDSPPEVIEGHMRWRTEMQTLNQELWEASKVLEPIQADPSSPHPFIRIISHSKGKKAIPRVFRHLDDQQRLTMLTLIVIHLDSLDVIRDAYPPADNTPIPSRVKDEVEVFSQAVMPTLFSYVNEAPLNIIIGLLGLVLDRVHVQVVARTKVGVSILTMLVSRAELVTQAISSLPSPQEADDKAQWQDLYSRLFDTIEPVLPFIFPTETNVSASDDVYVWQFLAAMGVGASPDQQQRLVLGVKDRVMDTVGISKTLPEDMAARRLGDVNLFMRAIGLDVELLG